MHGGAPSCIIPATGGGPYLPHGAGTGPIQRAADFNVQWDTNLYPTDQVTHPEHPFFEVEAVTLFDTAVGSTGEAPGKLRHCFAQFRWDSCPDGEDMRLGGQLNVGTVFACRLPTGNGPLTFTTVDIWVKARISVTNRLDSVYLVLDDDSGAQSSQSSVKSSFSDDNWAVVHHQENNLSSWNNSNLRSTISFLGTTNTSNIGRVKVDIEWFAFGLSA